MKTIGKIFACLLVCLSVLAIVAMAIGTYSFDSFGDYYLSFDDVYTFNCTAITDASDPNKKTGYWYDDDDHYYGDEIVLDLYITEYNPSFSAHYNAFDRDSYSTYLSIVEMGWDPVEIRSVHFLRRNLEINSKELILDCHPD